MVTIRSPNLAQRAILSSPIQSVKKYDRNAENKADLTFQKTHRSIRVLRTIVIEMPKIRLRSLYPDLVSACVFAK